MFKFFKWLYKKIFGSKIRILKDTDDDLKKKAKLTFKQRIARIRLNLREGKKKRRESRMSHLEKVKTRTAIRNKIRKELGKKHGVNWKRITLHSKVVDEKVEDYFIKEHAVRESLN